MRRSSRHAKTSGTNGTSTASDDITNLKGGKKMKRSSNIQENHEAVVEDENPQAKRFKVKHIATIPSEKSDLLFSGRSRVNNINMQSAPSTDLINSKGITSKVKPIEKSTAMSQQANTASQSQDLTLLKVESHDESKENLCEPCATGSDQDELQHYLKMREQNIKANEDFFSSIGLSQAKELLQQSTTKKVLPSKRGLKINKEEPQPIRHSLRIRRIDPTGNPLPEPYVAEVVEESRLPSGPISMKEYAYSKTDEISHEYVGSISSLICSRKPVTSPVSINHKAFCSALEKATITETRVAKVVPGRIFSVCWHPQSLVCAAGDKNGYIGLWDVATSETNGQDIVRAFRPHTKPVSDLFISPADPHKLYSCSYDSTLRCGNFEKEIFEEVFSVPEVNDDLLRNISSIDNVHSMLVSHFSGNVSLVDTRTPTTSAEQVFPVSKKSLRTVSVHPTQTHYFITAGIDATIALWDLRSISQKSPKPIQKLEDHTKAISSAYFSPTGHKVLSCSSDDTFLIYSTTNEMKLELTKRMRHNNYTGRWLTKFQPNWHPTVHDVFVSGSMHRPRQIEVFNANGDLLKALTDEDFLGSVCSLNAFHPNKTCTLVGGNSSGRLHIFM